MASSQSPKATPTRPATSRLLAMKFMNRLGGSADSPPTPSSPLASSEPSTPLAKFASAGALKDAIGVDGRGDESGRRSAKRRRVSGVSDAAGKDEPEDGAAATMATMEAQMKASMDEEERRRQAAIKKRAAELGDEQWTWDRPLPPHIAARMAAAGTAASKSRTMAYSSVVRVGFAEIDSADHSSDADPIKPTIMRFNMKKSKAAGESTGDSDEDGEDEGELANIGGSRKRSRSDAGGQRKKGPPMKLKHLTSLSSQGGQNTMKCHRCGRAGHKSASCPSTNLKRSGSKKR
ncbi:hypothetical protein CMQ_7666 [Grosmannia clavigera kw1407]|uniref:CCHC-type domain-containing protein n=1 Tax=Grosmannia clavigera (strain kw1407 / UAMH 11150) TaxID=655863 RepID=F0XPM1_GROCL|nr:uncharacterized protein CMQ_7666 [Grosmannia clavigera kw1407]EFX00664.1 hypothetical protein CMQ_7666 [Grosmannia clavigera kw1407]